MKMYKLLIVHILISVLFYIVNRKKSKDDSIYKFLTVLFIPFFGIMYFMMLYILDKAKYDSTAELNSYEQYIKMDLNRLTFNNVDKIKGSNVIPAKEALILNENKIKRNMVIDIIKENPKENISILKEALENSDTESAHYAATAIAEIKKEYVSRLQQMSSNHKDVINGVENLKEYINTLKDYINSGLLDERSIKKYIYIYSERLEELLEKPEIEEKYYIDKIECEIQLNEFLSAKKYCDKFDQVYEGSEETYLMYLKLYYKLQDYEKFESKFDELKKSELKLTKKALDLVRFWNVGDKFE